LNRKEEEVDIIISKYFIEISGVLNIAAGVLLLVYWYAFAIFMPYRELNTTLSLLVKNRNWVHINTIGVLGAMAGLLGQAGLFVVQIDRASWVGLVGYFIASIGTILLIGTMLWETILWPILVSHDESLLDFQGPIYRSKVYLPFFIVSGLIYSAGYILVGVGVMQTDILSRIGGLLLAVGAPTFGLGALFGKLQVYPRSIGVTLLSVGLIWLGVGMLG
jgi:hypothetical protein